ncbi:hypothetical protein TNCV_677781 [Trichonephila clavipes]|nr:hypothetical protein TNCV_677781 [Trichonephila clavipes]
MARETVSAVMFSMATASGHLVNRSTIVKQKDFPSDDVLRKLCGTNGLGEQVEVSQISSVADTGDGTRLKTREDFSSFWKLCNSLSSS